MTLATYSDAQYLVLHESLNPDTIRHQLKPVGFTDWEAAYRCLKRISNTTQAPDALADTLPYLLTKLGDTTNPDQVLVNFERFVNNAANELDLYHDFVSNPRAINILLTIFEGSQFLTEILLRNPKYFERLTAHHELAQPKIRAEFHTEAQSILGRTIDQADPKNIPTLNSLRRYQRWELLRIGTSDLLGAFDLPTITRQLSYLADSLVQASLTLAARQLGLSADDFFVVAMGKLGGEELNYSSDIDLLFLSTSPPITYRQLGQRLIQLLTRMTGEGFLYRVDMRLRPWGSTGELVSSIDAYLIYLQKHAHLWEKQALLKARVIAGNKTVGAGFLRQIQPHLFNTPPEIVRDEIRSLKERIENQLHRRGRKWGEVKLGQGSIRDIEFVTQYNQLTHGKKLPQLRTQNTLDTLSKLFAHDLLDADEYRILNDGYTFLRTTEHHLQLMHYQQTHTLPAKDEDLHHLARRLGFQGKNAGKRFADQYEQHATVIRLVFDEQLGKADSEPTAALPGPDKPKSSPQVKLVPHIARMHASYLKTFNEAEIERHTDLIEQLNDRHPVKVDTAPIGKHQWLVTIVGYDYLGELSLICGLLFVYGFNIHEGQVFTYEPASKLEDTGRLHQKTGSRYRSYRKSPVQVSRQKIVDVFKVSSDSTEVDPERWADYERDLTALVRQLRDGKQQEAQGELAKRIASTLKHVSGNGKTLYPVHIEIDNEASRKYTVLNIEAPDTLGFLYELTSALALHGINIGRVLVNTMGNRVRDILYVTNRQNEKITSADKQLELRMATVLIKQFTHLLPHSPNPEAALLNFREFVGHLFMQPNWPQQLASFEQPEVLTTMAHLLGASNFLWQDFLRMQHENLFPILQNVQALAEGKSKSNLRAELAVFLGNAPHGAAQREALNAFKDREIFRIDMRQILGHIELEQFSVELTDLAEVVVEAAYRTAVRELRAQYGLPRLDNRHPCMLTICALGKCGGQELGFASDIELMFIYAGNGRTTGPRVITNAEFFDKLVAEVQRSIWSKREGIFEVDLQLRPYGKAGSLGVSLESFRRYFAPDGDAWPYERQALVKLRPITGDVKLGQSIVKLRDEFIYNEQAFDDAAMRAMRERQIRHHVSAGTINAKLSPGGLVDIEYLVQGLQITYGHRYQSLRVNGTREALTAMAAAGIIPNKEYVQLCEALEFFHSLINALRMVHGNAKDLTVPPRESDAFAFLARRMHYQDSNKEQLHYDMLNHMTRVQEINEQLLNQ